MQKRKTGDEGPPATPSDSPVRREKGMEMVEGTSDTKAISGLMASAGQPGSGTLDVRQASPEKLY